MVDLSATLLHHGHIRLLKKAAELGSVVVGLTTDEEILAKKGYQPELNFEARKEILSALEMVDEVLPSPWLLDQAFLDQHRIDYLVHGDDNANQISADRLKLFPRTEGVSSSEIRQRAQGALVQKKNQKFMLTPGPAAILHENLQRLGPVFGRGDDEYTQMVESVTAWIKELSGQEEVVMAQGSATFGLELAAHSFVSGKVLLVSTGYYSDRLQKLLPKNCTVSVVKYEDLETVTGTFDWFLCAYTETSTAFKLDLSAVRRKADQSNAKLYVDATGSIGLEDDHQLADLMAFSSCKGLFGLTGAAFVAYKKGLKQNPSQHFYFNLETQRNKMVTGPYHAIASLAGVRERHPLLRQRVRNSKERTLEKWSNLVRKTNQPLLCTYLEGEVIPNDENIVLYSPRSELSGSVICHFGDLHHEALQIDKRIRLKVS